MSDHQFSDPQQIQAALTERPTLLGFPVVEMKVSRDRELRIGSYVTSADIVEMARRCDAARVPFSRWAIHPNVFARLNRAIRRARLVDYRGQLPKTRRVKRGGKRLL